MKWIGQHIWSFISRFRSDVYLESLATTTETNVLVVDSAGKVSKSTSVAGDLTSIVAGTGLSGTSLTGPIPTLNVDTSQTQITAVGTIGTGIWHATPIATAYIGDDQVTEDKLADTLLAEIDANTAKETNVVQTTVSGTSATVTAGTQAAITTCANLTTVGTIGTGTWNGTVIASNYLDSDTAHLSGVQTFNGLKTFSNSIIYDGDRNATPGDGAAIHVDSSDITDNNTSASGTASAFNYVSIENPRIMASNSLVTTTNAATVFIKGAPVASTNQTITNAWALNINSGNVDISTVTAGTWNGTAIASAYLDADTAHLSGTQTFSGTKTFSNTISGAIDGNAATATILGTARAINGVDFDGSTAITVTAAGSTLSDTVTVAKGGTGQTSLAANTVLTGNGTSGIVAESNLTYDGTNLTATSGGTSAPDVIIESTSNHSTGGNLIFRKLRADDTPADGNLVGSIIFQGEDDANNAQTYGSIVGVSQETGSGTEGGKIAINVASHDGETNTGLFIVDGSAEDEVDVTIGNGAGSVTTVAGNLDVTGSVLPGITYVKILPSDFMPDDGGRPAMIDDTSGDRWLESHGTGKLFAFVEIPPGFKATECIIYGSATSAITVYEADVNSATVTSRGTGNIGTIIDGGDFTNVTSDATNYIMIELVQASGEKVYGGKMTIAKA